MSAIGTIFKDKAGHKHNSNRVCEMLKKKEIGLDKINLTELGEAILGREAMNAGRFANEEGCAVALREAADPVSLQAFSNITQTLVYVGAVEAYNNPAFIGDSLMTQEQSNEDNTRLVGLANIDDTAMVVGEGEEFPTVKFGEDYQDIPRSVKIGLKIAITREMLFFDKTGKAVEMARTVGDRVRTHKEKRQLKLVMGITNNFNRKGVARNTYVAAGGGDPRVNKLAGNLLVDWTDIDNALQLFTAMVDDRSTGEPIRVEANTILASPYHEMTVKRILNATDIRTFTNSGDIRTDGGNPINKSYKLVTSPWFDWLLVESGVSAANAKEYWELGDPQKAFVYRTIFPFGVRQAGANDPAEFERDIVLQFRADERGVAYVKSPWHMVQSTN